MGNVQFVNVSQEKPGSVYGAGLCSRVGARSAVLQPRAVGALALSSNGGVPLKCNLPMLEDTPTG